MLEGGFRLVPQLVRTDAFLRPVGKLDAHVGKAEVLIDRQDQIVHGEAFGCNLIFRDENVRVVLGECAHPHQPVQRTGRFEPMHLAEFGKPERQIAVGLEAVLEDLNVAGAIHRLDHEGPLVLFAGLRQEHRIAERLHVAGCDPQG